MRYFQRVSLALFVGFWISASGPVQAQEDWKDEPKSMTLADVMLTDVVSAEELGVVSGSFTLTGNMGRENGVTYGVAVFDAENRTLLDAKTFGGPTALFQGEGKRFDFQYALPDWLSGEVSVMLLVENDRGVLLGARELVKKTVSGAKPSFSCRMIDGERLSVSCESSQGAELTLKYSKNSPLSEKFGETSLRIEPGKPSAVTPDLSPGQYFAFVSDQTGKTSIVPLRVKGAYGQIKNISIARTAGGIPEATVLIYGSALSDASLSLETKGKDGAVCFAESQVLVDPVFAFKLKEDCTEGTVIVTLKNKEGAILDQVAEPFSVLPFSAESEAASPSQRGSGSLFGVVKFGLFFLIGLGILIFGIQWFRKRRSMLGLFVFAFSLAGLAPAQDAEAISQFIYLWSTARGEYAWTCNVTTNLNKASYAPGETATLYTSGTLSWDAGSDPGDGNCYANYIFNVGQTAPAFDGEAPGGLSTITSGTMTRGPAISHSFSGSANFTMPATLPNGSHYLRIYSTVSGDCNGDVTRPCTGTFRSDVDNLGFTIDPNICEWAQWFAPDASTWDTIGEGSLTPGQSITGQAGGSKHIFTCTGTGAAVCNVNPGGDSGGSSRTVTATCSLGASPDCDLGCGGSMQWRANATNAIDDFTCPADSKLIVNDGGWTGPGACNGTFTRDPGGSFSCVADAACIAPPVGNPCWQLTGTRTVSAASCTYPMSPPLGPAFPACTAGNQGAVERRCDDDQPGLDLESTRTCGMCAAPPSCTWQDIGYTNGFFEVQNNSRAEYVCNTAEPTWFLSNICPGTTTAGGVSLQANGYRCYDSSTKFAGFAPTYESGMCLAKAYRTVCTGSPTLIMTGMKRVGFGDQSLWSKVFAVFRQHFVNTVSASGPTVNIASGESVTLNWTTTGAASCTLTVPGQLPQAVAPAQIASGTTVVSGLPAGLHTIRMTCADAAGTQTVTDTVVVNVAAPVPDLKICPRGSIPLSGNGGTTLLRAYYVPNGTVDCGNTSAAVDVTGTSVWSTSNAGVATVAAGVVTSTTNTAGSSATISATYLGLTDSGATILITCVPTNSCASAGPAATAANRCPADTFTINDGCGGIVTCPGTRVCDFNWKEVGQ